MNWTLGDFIVFAGMLGAVAAGVALVFRRSPDGRYRIAAGTALIAAFLLCWVNGAVGIIGSENNDANLMFLGVLASGIIGAALARLRPRGMVRAMVATALVQIAVGVIAVLAGLGTEGARWPADVIGATAFFSALWLAAAWLFRGAAAPGANGVPA